MPSAVAVTFMRRLSSLSISMATYPFSRRVRKMFAVRARLRCASSLISVGVTAPLREQMYSKIAVSPTRNSRRYSIISILYMRHSCAMSASRI